MSSENTTPPYENIDLDFMDFDFSFDDAGIFYGETVKRNHVDSEGANRNNQGFDSQAAKQNDLKNEDVFSQAMKNQIDYTSIFTTTQMFDSKDELVSYCRSIDVRGQGNTGLEILKTKEPLVQKKCKCPFKLKATGLRCGGWKYFVVDGRHNHDLPVYAEGHTTGKFQEAEYKLTSELTKSFMAHNDILRTLKRVTNDNSSIIKHVNNARQKLRAEEMEGRRPIQQFQKFLTENGYYQFFRKGEGTNMLSDIFFMHPESYKMLNAWPYVITMDCTYKMNRYELPLLEVVGFSPTWLTFIVAYCFLNTEKEETFVWALKNLRSFFIFVLPSTIVTDPELGLINVIAYFSCFKAYVV
ncbi:hypothetical protein LIER_32101 [Lithospermum erythrorhizon]|uniref:MULE transposase domain-containing protein n=1 Tax=Lithospermum erythrorhizon TaxID=34254 RepID=A0AAV3RSZ2_LITER